MSLFTEYEKQRELKSKLQIDSHWRWRGPEYRYNEITLTRITSTTVYYYYVYDKLGSSMLIESFMREAVYLGPVVEPAH
jgi:hypothetical protein